jgi:hypothetical protein
LIKVVAHTTKMYVTKMLVLALQFSRSDADQRCAEIESSRPLAVAERDDSLKTEEKTVTPSDRRSKEGPNPCDLEVEWLTAHQCTN